MKPDVEAYLIGLENSLLDESVRKSERIIALLADDYVEFGSSGTAYTKEQVIAALKDEPPRNIKASEFKAREFIPGNVLVSYRANQDGHHTLRSSLWQHRAGKWQLVFHQGTVITP